MTLPTAPGTAWPTGVPMNSTSAINENTTAPDRGCTWRDPAADLHPDLVDRPVCVA